MGGIVIGLWLAELGFAARDNQAFPHLNLYVADAALGARLEPNSEMGFQLRDNPRTSIRINSAGYRGDEWGPPTKGDIVVVGDSQAFGLGVEYEETFSAKLASLLRRPVRNAGVPTYGPPEMELVVKELLATRHPGVVIYTVNMANDLFEVDRPNRMRHGIWDGWAVRSETMPATLAPFPGRRWLMSQSHLVYAARRWLAEDEPLPVAGFVSEGTFSDLVAVGAKQLDAHQRAEAEVAALRSKRAETLKSLNEELQAKERVIRKGLNAVVDQSVVDDTLLLDAAIANPGDIVEENYEESSRQVLVTAEMIRQGARLRDRLIKSLEHPDAAVTRELTRYPLLRKDVEGTRAALPVREQLLQQRAALLRETAFARHIPSVLTPRLQSIKALTDAAGAELLVLVLPLDVQVSDDEWRKYGGKRVDMASSQVLNRDVVASARRLGVRALDATASIRAVSGQRFLDHDIHMTPGAHASVARALVQALEEPAPLRLPTPGLPEGRTPVPTRDEWYRTEEVTVRGSTAAGCSTVRVREWLRVTCLPGEGQEPGDVEVLEHGTNEAFTTVTDSAVTLVTTLLPGQPVRARFFWKTRVRDLLVGWPTPQAPAMSFEDVAEAKGRPRAPGKADARLCECWNEVMQERGACAEERYGRLKDCVPSCTYAYGDASAECLATYPSDCQAFLACASGDPAAPPICADGEAVAGSAGQCHALCDSRQPCGTTSTPVACVAWQGSGICP